MLKLFLFISIKNKDKKSKRFFVTPHGQKKAVTFFHPQNYQQLLYYSTDPYLIVTRTLMKYTTIWLALYE